MITSTTYVCKFCGKPRTEKYESCFRGIKPEDYKCAECYRKQRKKISNEVVSFICCVCGKESGKRHLYQFKLKDHKWTCVDCSRMINDVQKYTS